MMKKMKRKHIISRRMWKLEEHKIRTKFEERVKEPVDVEASKSFKNDVLKAVMNNAEEEWSGWTRATRGGGMRI